MNAPLYMQLSTTLQVDADDPVEVSESVILGRATGVGEDPDHVDPPPQEQHISLLLKSASS